MKVLADMGISQTTVSWLRQKGHDAIHVREQDLQSIPDVEVIQKAEQEHRIVLTCDLDFGDIKAAKKGVTPSVIIFRLQNEKPENVNKRLQQVLLESSEVLEKGAVVAVEETRHRIRLLPI